MKKQYKKCLKSRFLNFYFIWWFDTQTILISCNHWKLSYQACLFPWSYAELFSRPAHTWNINHSVTFMHKLSMWLHTTDQTVWTFTSVCIRYGLFLFCPALSITVYSEATWNSPENCAHYELDGYGAKSGPWVLSIWKIQGTKLQTHVSFYPIFHALKMFQSLSTKGLLFPNLSMLVSTSPVNR